MQELLARHEAAHRAYQAYRIRKHREAADHPSTQPPTTLRSGQLTVRSAALDCPALGPCTLRLALHNQGPMPYSPPPQGFVLIDGSTERLYQTSLEQPPPLLAGEETTWVVQVSRPASRKVEAPVLGVAVSVTTGEAGALQFSRRVRDAGLRAVSLCPGQDEWWSLRVPFGSLNPFESDVWERMGNTPVPTCPETTPFPLGVLLPGRHETEPVRVELRTQPAPAAQ